MEENWEGYEEPDQCYLPLKFSLMMVKFSSRNPHECLVLISAGISNTITTDQRSVSATFIFSWVWLTACTGPGLSEFAFLARHGDHCISWPHLNHWMCPPHAKNPWWQCLEGCEGGSQCWNLTGGMIKVFEASGICFTVSGRMPSDVSSTLCYDSTLLCHICTFFNRCCRCNSVSGYYDLLSFSLEHDTCNMQLNKTYNTWNGRYWWHTLTGCFLQFPSPNQLSAQLCCSNGFLCSLEVLTTKQVAHSPEELDWWVGCYHQLLLGGLRAGVFQHPFDGFLQPRPHVLSSENIHRWECSQTATTQPLTLLLTCLAAVSFCRLHLKHPSISLSWLACTAGEQILMMAVTWLSHYHLHWQNDSSCM